MIPASVKVIPRGNYERNLAEIQTFGISTKRRAQRTIVAIQLRATSAMAIRNRDHHYRLYNGTHDEWAWTLRKRTPGLWDSGHEPVDPGEMLDIC